jgi:hypothetical protein
MTAEPNLCAYYEAISHWNMPGYDHHDEHEADPGHYFKVPLLDEGSLKVPVCEEHAERLHYLYMEHKFVDPPGVDPRTPCDVCGIEWRRHGR